MLVYANLLSLKPERSDVPHILEAVDSWLRFRTRKQLLATPNVNKPAARLPDGKELEVLVSREDGNQHHFRGVVVFSHPDDRVSGRKWFTRVGFSRDNGSQTTKVSVVCETSDISVQAGSSAVFATRPGVVVTLGKKCGFVPPSPSAFVHTLTPENASALKDEIFDSERSYAIVVLSKEPFSERCYVDPQELATQILGLGKVFIIENKAHTKEIVECLGRRWAARGGDMNVIMPPFKDGYVRSTLIPLENLKYETGRDKSPERYVLYLLTHRLNLPNFQQEITPAMVRQHALTLRLKSLQVQTTSLEQQKAMLDIYQQQLAERDTDIERLKQENSNIFAEWTEADKRGEEIPKLRAQVEAFQSAFRKLKSEGRITTQDNVPITSVAEAIEAAKEKFPQVLAFAFNSKSEDQSSPFQPATELFEAFDWLASVYAPARNGKARCSNFDHSIREQIPGWSYSGHQSDGTAGRFKEWYRCQRDGKSYDVLEHIGCGVRSRPEETIRVAFTWDQDEGLVVIGYIGQHQKNSKS